ncbi:hypothetical protein D3C87_1880430 [compost metagenome]
MNGFWAVSMARARATGPSTFSTSAARTARTSPSETSRSKRSRRRVSVMDMAVSSPRSAWIRISSSSSSIAASSFRLVKTEVIEVVKLSEERFRPEVRRENQL